LACYAPLSGLNAPFLCHSAVIAHSPALFTPLGDRLLTAPILQSPSESFLVRHSLFARFSPVVPLFGLFLFELLSAHEFFIIFRHLPAPSLTLRTPSTGCCFIFKLLNFIGVSLFMGHRRQKHYISISTCLPTPTPHFISLFSSGLLSIAANSRLVFGFVGQQV